MARQNSPSALSGPMNGYMENRRTYKALILDDDLTVQALLARFLASRHWECVLVDNGRAALGLFRPGEFDLVLADVDLGSGLDGITTVMHLLAFDRDLYAVLMSGDPRNLDEAEEIGLSTIDKPFDLCDIGVLLLRAEVRRRRMRNPL
jgi:DNA-binding response OmpR family regulator